MRKFLIYLLFLIILLALLSGCNDMSCDCINHFFNGSNQSGIIIANKESPLIVENNLLTFDLQEFPNVNYIDIADFLSYTGKITAEYSLHNPSDKTVNEKVFFYIGEEASYADFNNADANKYDVLIDGESVEKKIRHTLSIKNEELNLEKSIDLILDSFVEDDFYSPELSATKYTFRINGVDTKKYDTACIAFDVPKGLGSNRIYLPNSHVVNSQKDDFVRINMFINNNRQVFELYVFGTPLSVLPEWKVYKDTDAEDKDIISGNVSLVSTESLTFKDFALENWSAESGVSEMDWYNSTVTEINKNSSYNPDYPIVDLYLYEMAFVDQLDRWYEYDIAIESGERIKNTVITPAYPYIDTRYDSNIYEYTYLISSSKSWKSFGETEIIINTPYYLFLSSYDGFVKSESGYTLKLNNIPDEELKIEMSAVEDPWESLFTETFPWADVAVCVLFVLLIGFVIFVFVKRKKKNRSEPA